MSDEIVDFETKLSVGTIMTNYEDAEKQALAVAEKYKTMTFTDENIPEAKKAIAAINKLVKAIDAERISIKKQWNKPVVEYEQKNKKIQNILLSVAEGIKKVVDDDEKARVMERENAIKSIFDELNPFDWLTADKIKNEKWLNKTTTTNEIQIEIQARLDLIKMTIDGYNADFNDKYLPILINAYQQTLNDQFARDKRREAIEKEKEKSKKEESKKEQEKAAETPAHSEQIEVAAGSQGQQEQATKRVVVRLELEVTPEGWSKLQAAIKADPNIVVLKCEY